MRGDATFRSTRWSVVRRAAAPPSADSHDALAELCTTYWYPLYAFCRRRGFAAEEAEDLVQGFFANFLELDHVKAVDSERGRFRAYLLGALKHHLGHERDRRDAVKRGGGVRIFALDRREGETRFHAEPAHSDTPERAFQRDWCIALLGRVRETLREQYAARKRSELFDRLAPHIGGPGPETSHVAAAEELGMTEVAVKVAVHRLRRRYGELLREEVAQTLEEDDDVESEIRALMESLS